MPTATGSEAAAKSRAVAFIDRSLSSLQHIVSVARTEPPRVDLRAAAQSPDRLARAAVRPRMEGRKAGLYPGHNASIARRQCGSLQIGHGVNRPSARATPIPADRFRAGRCDLRSGSWRRLSATLAHAAGAA